METNILPPEVTEPTVQYSEKCHRCAFPAPKRCWFQTASGQWASREWRLVDQNGEEFNECHAYEIAVLGQHRQVAEEPSK